MIRIKHKNMFLCAIMLVFVFLFPMFTVGCDGKDDSAKLSNCGIIHEPEFGGVYIKNTIEQFNALGFTYGDSVNISFSNGYEMKNIPLRHNKGF